jgi:hypothetical protein
MKSAYELAMERLEQESGPSKKLTDEQRDQLADLDKLYDAKKAELALSFDAKVAAAASIEDLEKIREDQAEATVALEAEREAKKEAIWNEA